MFYFNLMVLGLSAIMAELGPPKLKKVISSCPDCEKNSRVGRLQQYSVNLEDSLVLCDNELVCYIIILF